MASKLTKSLWITLTVVVVGFTAYAVVRNLLHIAKIGSQLRDLRREGAAYRAQIEADSALIEQLRYDDYLERYAREHFNMQKKGERVFVMED